MKKIILFGVLSLLFGNCHLIDDVDCCVKDLSVTSFTLIRSHDLTDLKVLSDSIRLDNDSNVGIFWDPADIRAEVLGNAENVHFEMTGPNYDYSRTADSAPYLLYDDPNNLTEPRFHYINGFFTLTATPYAKAGRKVRSGTPLTMTIEVYNSCIENQEASIVTTTPSTTVNSSDGTATVNTPIQLTDDDYSWSHDPNLEGPVAIDLAPGIYTVTFGNSNCGTTIEYTISAQ